jgi:uncharacterized protein (DUF983 family)
MAVKQSISSLRSMFGLKCPRCRKGKLFTRKGLFVYRDILKMPENCEVCDQKFEIEPGFWIGAMWISYPFVVAIEMPFLILALLADANHVWMYFALMVAAFLITWPFLLRIGRSAWIHVSIRYDKKL